MQNDILRSVIKRVIPYSGLKLLGNKYTILPYYHIVSDSDVLHVKSLYKYKNIKQFTDDLDFLLKHYVARDIFEIMQYNKYCNPVTENGFLLTFDDGFREINDIIAPILLNKGIPAVFFLNSSFIDNRTLCYQHKASILVGKVENGLSNTKELKIRSVLAQMGIADPSTIKSILSVNYGQRDVMDTIAEIAEIDFNEYLKKNQPYLTSEQINGLIRKGFKIGAHSIDHPLYANLTLEEQLSQTIESTKKIREQFNLSYGAFAFPHSDTGVNLEFFKKLQVTGLIDISFGTGGMLADMWHSHFQRFSLEKPIVPAKEIISWHYARRFYKKLKCNSIIKH